MKNDKGVNMQSFDLNDYISPKGEMSSHKGIPMEFRNHPDVLAAKDAGGATGRIRYRGPRKDWMALTCLMEDAISFAIYPETRTGYNGLIRYLEGVK